MNESQTIHLALYIYCKKPALFKNNHEQLNAALVANLHYFTKYWECQEWKQNLKYKYV